MEQKSIQINIWSVTFFLALIVAFFFLRPFLGTILLAAVLAFLFNPLYQKFRKTKLLKHDGVAAMTTFGASIVTLGIPIGFLITLTVAQAANIVTQIRDSNLFTGNTSFSESLNSIVNSINETARSIAGTDEIIKTDQLSSFFAGKVPDIIQTGTNILVSTIGGVPQFITLFILYIFLFAAFLTYQKDIVRLVKDLSPFPDSITNTYFKKLSATINTAVKGQLIIATAQGLLGAISIAIVGFENYFFLAFVAFTILNFIPLGSGLVTIPLGLVLLITGNIWQGTVVLFTHLIIVTNIDNFLRPKVMSKDAKLPAVLILLATFAGVYHFGFIGVIYGPIVMILITTTFETYLLSKKSASS